MNKVERKARERATVYRVFKTYEKIGSVYTVLKLYHGNVEGTCDVTVKFDSGRPDVLEVIWCTCMGFLCQKFPHIEHKHVRLVLDYIKRGMPEQAEYKLTGTGRKTKITFIGVAEA